MKRTVKLFDHHRPKNINDAENPKSPPPNQSSSNIINPKSTNPSSTRRNVSNETKQQAAGDLVTPTENKSPTTALISSTSLINILNTSSKLSKNQIVLLPQNISSKCIEQLMARKSTDPHKLNHGLLVEERSSKNLSPYTDNTFTLTQITEVQQSFQPLYA